MGEEKEVSEEGEGGVIQQVMKAPERHRMEWEVLLRDEKWRRRRRRQQRKRMDGSSETRLSPKEVKQQS